MLNTKRYRKTRAEGKASLEACYGNKGRLYGGLNPKLSSQSRVNESKRGIRAVQRWGDRVKQEAADAMCGTFISRKVTGSDSHGIHRCYSARCMRATRATHWAATAAALGWRLIGWEWWGQRQREAFGDRVSKTC